MNKREKKYPFLLVQKGKHGDSYYHIADNGDFKRALIDIFRDHDEIGYYDGEEPEYYENEIAIQEEIIKELTPVFEQLAESSAKSDIGRHLRSASQRIRYAQYSLGDARVLKKIREGETDLIPKFVWDRRDGEYEGIEEERYSNIDAQ